MNQKIFTALLLSFPIFLIGQPWDQYGGNSSVPGKKTGHWHIEQIESRYWFITPEGNSMYVLGINHIDAKGQKDRELALANLEKWHFNSGGYGIPKWLLPHLPGFLSVRLHDALHWLPADGFSFADVFSKSYAEHVDSVVEVHCRTGRDNPNVIGYSLTDTPRYDLDIVRARRGSDWVSFMRTLSGNQPGKRAYVDFLRKTYQGNFHKFRTAYRLESPQSFDELYDYPFAYLELARTSIRRDDEVFLTQIVEKIYELIHQSFRNYHPEALLLSEKFKSHDHPEAILRLAGKYFDVISIQPGPTQGPDVGQGPDESIFDPMYWENLHRLTGKPLFITDHGFSFFTEAHPRTLWHQFVSETEAATFYDHYVREVIKLPFIVGYMKCQYKDRYDPLRTLLKQGLLMTDGRPYELLSRQVSETNAFVIEQLYK